MSKGQAKTKIKLLQESFYDYKDIAHKEFAPGDKTVNGECCLGVLHCLWRRIGHARPTGKYLFS